MSRGMGKVERAVLEVITEKGCSAPSVIALTGAVAEKLNLLVPYQNRGVTKMGFTPSLYRSVLRAVRSLDKKGRVMSLSRSSEMVTEMYKFTGQPSPHPRETEVMLSDPDGDDGNT